MKRITIIGLVALLAVSAVSAQGFGQWQGGPGMPGMTGPAVAQTQVQKSTIEGKLSLVQGHPAIVIKEKTYYVQLPQTLYGFIDGLKEGASVKVEGYEFPIQIAANTSFFRATSLTLAGKTYDLSQTFGYGMSGMAGGARGSMGGYGQTGRGGAWDSGPGSFGGRGRW